ncbi:Na+/H+ antiporter [Mucilaginibacter psychrotolerans]|uniref:Na+/H+ antiporter n=1 Tax=Mucilaginibacter psychrotolerans TaxID=1524096 RepID=A0A4Y8SGI6_9SPHI|nr:Na+/H+ antiporter [Mucilaginibacter psychrotolerans]TFF37755.1 Na+/H+ antiporter [Mucilaginibacter psychrotolerans]
MHYTLFQFLLLLTAVVMLIMLAQKLKIAYPLFLVIAGLLISCIPHIPAISINPELIFLIFLPPLLFEAAWYTSWNDFWKWRRPISLLSFGLVIFTSTIVAVLATAMIPGFTLPMGFLLGGIISPPDAIAATSVLKNVKIPIRITTILEGESLVNDASSLIVLRFALAAVLTGQFSFHEAVGTFIVVTFMGIFVGLAVANIMYAIHRYLPTTASIDSVFTLISPYFMYLAAEQFHFSGVMAVVSGGLFLSYRSHEIFTNGQSRLQVISVWSTLIIILNGLVFILIGLELPEIMNGMSGYSLPQAIKYSLAVSLVIMAIRMMWIYPATFIPRWLFKNIRKSEPAPGWKGSFIVGWAGMRGVVSLAAALSLPMFSSGGKPFPHRELIIFITFIVILVTLVFQGLTLPFIIKSLKITEIDPVTPDDQQLAGIQIRLAKVSLDWLHEKYPEECESNELIRGYKSELEHMIAHASETLRCISCGASGKKEIDQYNKVLKDIYEQQRKTLYHLRKEKTFSDSMIRKEEKQVDLNETKILVW